MTIKHQIRLPIRFAEPGAASERLLRQEFDNVTIGLDPRPALLLKYLAVNLPPIMHLVAENEVIDDKLISRLIRESLDARRAAVNAVLVRNNERLNELSQRGIIKLEQREQSFAELNTKEQLAEQQFPYLNEALKVFASTEYDDPKLPAFVSAPSP